MITNVLIHRVQASDWDVEEKHICLWGNQYEILPSLPLFDVVGKILYPYCSEAEAPILWLPDAKAISLENSLKDWRHEEKGIIENEMVGWHHQPSGHESE